MDRVRLCLLLACVWLSAASAEEVVFTQVSPLSRNEELVRRSVSRADAAALTEGLAKQSKRLAEQPVDPAGEQSIRH